MTAPRRKVHQTLDGKSIPLTQLSHAEQCTLAEILRAYRRRPDWPSFVNSWRAKVRNLYTDRPARERTSKALYLVGEDLEARLGVSQKYFREPDYRDQLDQLIAAHFPSRYAFCRATGLDQGYLSRLLHKSTHISVERLNRALQRIGWRLQLTRMKERASRHRNS